MAHYQKGDKVRVVQVPPYLLNGNAIDRKTAEFFGRCLRKVFRIQDFDEYGHLELWATDKGNDRKVYSGQAHTIWIEPEYVQPYPKPTGIKLSIDRQ